jgi:RNA polymerase-binding transcription factor DksA
MPLTPFQRKQLSRRIDRRRGTLIVELREDAARVRAEPYSKHAGPVADSGDESVATLLADLENADVTRDLDELRGLEAARQRLKEGRYGSCADCGGDIPYSRLKAAPGALRCEPCEERHEKTFAGTARPKL